MVRLFSSLAGHGQHCGSCCLATAAQSQSTAALDVQAISQAWTPVSCIVAAAVLLRPCQLPIALCV